VTSKDGSRIAYDRLGSGPTVILVVGALGYRKFGKMQELAGLLAESCTVINYDPRGRGDSTEVKPFALEREIEDIQALIEAAGGSASLWGWSSGGALALRAAAAGLAVERLSVYEVPFMVTAGAKRPTPDYGERLDELVAAGDRNGAVKHFMRNSMGIPAPFVALMRLMPMWKGLKATAHILPYDWAALGKHTMYGAPFECRRMGVGNDAHARRDRRQEPRRAARRFPRAGGRAAQRPAALAPWRQPQPEDEGASARAGRVSDRHEGRRRPAEPRDCLVAACEPVTRTCRLRSPGRQLQPAAGRAWRRGSDQISSLRPPVGKATPDRST